MGVVIGVGGVDVGVDVLNVGRGVGIGAVWCCSVMFGVGVGVLV